MRAHRLLPAILPAVVLALGGCGQTVVAPPPPQPPPPASLWTPADSQEVGKQMVDAMSRDTWVGEFTGKAGHPPHVLLGDLSDRTDDRVDMTELAHDLQAALGTAAGLAPANSRDDADFILSGGVNRQATGGGKFLYALDLHVTGTAHNDPVWARSVEREKAVPATP